MLPCVYYNLAAEKKKNNVYTHILTSGVSHKILYTTYCVRPMCSACVLSNDPKPSASHFRPCARRWRRKSIRNHRGTAECSWREVRISPWRHFSIKLILKRTVRGKRPRTLGGVYLGSRWILSIPRFYYTADGNRCALVQVIWFSTTIRKYKCTRSRLSSSPNFFVPRRTYIIVYITSFLVHVSGLHILLFNYIVSLTIVIMMPASCLFISTLRSLTTVPLEHL